MVFTVWAGESESPHDELAEGRQEGPEMRLLPSPSANSTAAAAP